MLPLPFRASPTILHLHKKCFYGQHDGYWLSNSRTFLLRSVVQSQKSRKENLTLNIASLAGAILKQHPNTVDYTFCCESWWRFVLYGFHSCCAGLAQVHIICA